MEVLSYCEVFLHKAGARGARGEGSGGEDLIFRSFASPRLDPFSPILTAFERDTEAAK